MNITDFEWLMQFVEKIERKHGVRTIEVEEIFFNGARIQRIERGHAAGEHLYRAVGQTDAGRYLAAFFIYKGLGKALIISARDASQGERKSYGKHKR
jgi:uncharacterized DUF497 family protein